MSAIAPPLGRRIRLWAAVSFVLAVVASVAPGPAAAGPSTPNVLLVGSYHGIPGPFASIQDAVNAAAPGDWVLVGPGDYHERGSSDPDLPAGVLITTDAIHLRGMDRNRVIVDATSAGALGPCDPGEQYQWLGPIGPGGQPTGANGVEVWKASGGSVENLTTCNYLTSADGENGNEIWWNGGDGSGQIGLHSYSGAYLTASSTYSNDGASPQGEYGIFVSNADGPGTIAHTYASNMADAAYYIGACPDCNAVLGDAHAQNNALGYSGTNSGGHLIIEDSEFDHNKTGVTTDSENNDDIPSPQDGACPAGGPAAGSDAASCEIWRNNYIHDNNNPNVPGVGEGLAGAAPIGTGIVVAGGRNDTITGNRIVRNGAWGILIVDQPYMGTPPPGAECQGGIWIPPETCYYQAWGSETASNFLKDNGTFGNPTNDDLAMAALPHDPGNCFHDNVDPAGVTSDPPNIQDPPYNPCSQPNGGVDPLLVSEVLCATQLIFPCPGLPGARYPRPTGVRLIPIPKQPSMPNPCRGVPSNPWCPSSRPAPPGGLLGGVAADRPRRR